MRILHISSPKTWRGGERQVYLLMKGLKSKHHTSFLMSPLRSRLAEKGQGIYEEHITLRKGLFSWLKNIQNIIDTVEKYRIDVIHGHDSFAHTLIYLAARYRGLSVPMVVSRRLDNPVKDRSRSKYNHPSIRKILCVSGAVKNTMVPFIDDASRLVVVHSGIALDTTYPKKKTEAFTIGYVAAFTAEKNHNDFIAIARKILHSHPHVKFVLAGDGPLKSEIERKVQNISASIEFLGFVEDIDAVYARLDGLLHTSHKEALGTAILDAMRYGLPVVAYNVGGISEIIDDGIHGFLHPSDDIDEMVKSIVKIIDDPALYMMMSKRNKDRVQLFSADKMAEKTLSIYDEIMD